MRDDMTNVLHVIDSLEAGGAQTILRGYFESRADDPSIHLYALREAPNPIAIAHPNVATRNSTGRFSIAPFADLRRIVRERRIGVLHCHLFRSQVFGLLVKRFFFPQLTLIFHEHGRAVGREGESGFEALTYRAFLRAAWQRVDQFICISEHTRGHLLRVIPAAAGKVSVVANPIPVQPRAGEAPDRAALRRENGIPEGAFVMGFASRLVERKGWGDFLDAAALLVPAERVYFLMAGDGEDRDKAQARMSALDLQTHGRMLGYIDWMARFYACLDCFVMPSHWEPHGLAHLEAQAFGVPVIVSDVPGLASTVRAGDDALLFKAGDPRALADCVRRLRDDPLLRARLVAGGIANGSRFTIETFSRHLDEIYSAAASARAARA